MNDFKKQYGTSSILHETLCIISNPSVNLNWSYSPETLNSGQNWRFCVPHYLQIWWMTLKNNRVPLLYYNMHHFKSIDEVKFQSGTAQCGSKFAICFPGDLEIWWMSLKNYRAPLLHYIELCASFQSYWYIRTGVTVRKLSILVKIDDFFVPHDLANWRVTLKNNRAPLLCCFELYASFHSHWQILTGVTVRKRPIWVQIDDFY